MSECQSNQSFTIGRWFYPKRCLMHLRYNAFLLSFYAFPGIEPMTLCYALPFKLQENYVSKCNQKMCIHEVCEKATHFVCMTLKSVSGTGSMSTAGAHGRYDYSQREQWECERCNKGYVGTRAQVLYSNRSLAMSSLSSVRSHTLSMTMILQQRKIHPNRMVKVVFHCFIWCLLYSLFKVNHSSVSFHKGIQLQCACFSLI